MPYSLQAVRVRRHFPRTALAAVLAASLLAACGGSNKHDNGGNPDPGTPPVTDTPVAEHTFRPNPGTQYGSADASTAIALDADWMVVADDEANVLRVYPRQGGAAVLEWDFSAEGPALAKELDVESSTLIGDLAFFLGSHGNSKDGGDAVDTRGHLFAVKINGTGADTRFAYAGMFSQLEQQLVAWDSGNQHGLGAGHFGFARSSAAGLAPERVDGFAIEGAATAPDGKTLWLGFRAPQMDQDVRHRALIVPVRNPQELIAGTASQAGFGNPIELNLGGRGIRAMAQGSDGQYLILAGPAGAASSHAARNFALYAWNGAASDSPREIANNLEAMRLSSGGSLESIVEVAGPVATGTRVQLLMDNGDTVFPGTSSAAKDLPEDQQRFLGVSFDLADWRAADSGPQLSASTPADDRQGVNVDTRLQFRFDQGIALGQGKIHLRRADGSLVESFSAGGTPGRVKAEYNQVSIQPAATLDFNTGYYIEIDTDAILGHAGLPYAGLQGSTALDFRTAGAPTPLQPGDVMFVGANAEAPDAFAFMLLKAVDGGTRIQFTDRDRGKKGIQEFEGLTNETAMDWTADRYLPAGTIVTIATDVTGNPETDVGFTLGAPGGLGKEETIYAMTGAVIDDLGDGTAGEIRSVGTFVASITLGGDKDNVIPASLDAAGTALRFVVQPANQTSAIYGGALDAQDPLALAARIRDTTNWQVRYKPEAGFPLVNGSLFGQQVARQ